ncbi:MAG: CtsR family transcriptional regulator [Oscillospiraceae bacterium]|jgi:transcriptional regulator CtsR|nr:CtsR family transcriptional regulator [Oscillospiraceae bacterium]
MRISDIISETIREMLEASAAGTAEIRRNELALLIGCVPSQINYVLESRFTPEQGYVVESRRGGGGYIRITRVQMDKGSALMHLINSIGAELDSTAARVNIANLFYQRIVSEETARLLSAAVANNTLREIPPASRAAFRANILKNMLITLMNSAERS